MSNQKRFKKIFKLEYRPNSFNKWAIRDVYGGSWYAFPSRREAGLVRTLLQGAYQFGFNTARQNCQIALMDQQKKWLQEYIKRAEGMNGDLE